MPLEHALALLILVGRVGDVLSTHFVTPNMVFGHGVEPEPRLDGFGLGLGLFGFAFALHTTFLFVRIFRRATEGVEAGQASR